MSDLTEFQYKLSQIHLDLYHLWLDIDTTDEEAEIVDKILEVFHGAWEAVPIPESLITEAKEIMQLAQDNRGMRVSRLNYSPRDIEILDELLSAGYGWSSFSRNIEEQGWISEKQRDTIYKMVNNLRAQKNKATQPKYGRSAKRSYGNNDNFEYLDYGGAGECF